MQIYIWSLLNTEALQNGCQFEFNNIEFTTLP